MRGEEQEEQRTSCRAIWARPRGLRQSAAVVRQLLGCKVLGFEGFCGRTDWRAADTR